MDLKSLISVQESLFKALNYFLYGSFNSANLPELPNSVLLSVAPLLNLNKHLVKLNPSLRYEFSFLNNIPYVKEKEYAKALSQSYVIWEDILTQFKGDLETKEIPSSHKYEDWLVKGGASDRYRAVHLLRDYLLREGAFNFFLRCLIHGSVATLDDVMGFSDLDTAFIIRSSVVKDFRKLVKVRHMASHILSFTYFFDPFMHHGPYYIVETDLNFYPEAYFPLVLFAYGVELVDDHTHVTVKARPSLEVTDVLIKGFENFFRERFKTSSSIKNSFDLEWVLSSVMLLPVLYLQRKTGVFRYKREALALAERDFTPEEWEPVKLSTFIRANIGPRPKVREWLLDLSIRLRFPNLIKMWLTESDESINRVKDVACFLGEDFVPKVLRFIASIKERLGLRR